MRDGDHFRNGHLAGTGCAGENYDAHALVLDRRPGSAIWCRLNMTIADLPALVGKSVTLRAPQRSDAVVRLRLGNDRDIARMYGGNTRDIRPMTMEDAMKWVDQLLGQDYAWIIEVVTSSGTSAFASATGTRASLAVGIDDPMQLERGLGTAAIGLVQGYALTRLNCKASLCASLPTITEQSEPTKRHSHPLRYRGDAEWLRSRGTAAGKRITYRNKHTLFPNLCINRRDSRVCYVGGHI